MILLVELLPQVADGLRVILAVAYGLVLVPGVVAFVTAVLGYW